MKNKDVSSWLSMRLLARLIPDDLRDAFVGDLLEEAKRVIGPAAGGWRLRLWLWAQMLGSLAALLGLRMAREGSMIKRKVGAAGIMVTMGILQGWDSRVFQSSPWIIAIVLIAILLPVMAVLRIRQHGRFAGALVIGCILLVLARFIAPTPIGSDLMTTVVVFWAASLLVYGPSATGGQRQDDRVA